MKRTNHDMLNAAVNHLYSASLELKTLRYDISNTSYQNQDLLEQIEGGVDKLVKSLQVIRREEADKHAKINRLLRMFGF